MPAYTDFQARVRRVIRRNDVYDADIPAYLKDAIRTLENLHNWRHMWRESFQQTLAAAESQISFLGLVKSVRYLRFAVPLVPPTAPLAGRFAYAKKSQPEDVRSGLTLRSMDGVRFWMTRQDSSPASVIQLSGAFVEPTLYDLGWYQFSDSTADDNPWYNWMDGGVLLAQALVEMSPLLRDEKMIARNEAVLARKLAALSEGDLTHQFDSDDATMEPYFDEMQEDLFSQREGGLP